MGWPPPRLYQNKKVPLEKSWEKSWQWASAQGSRHPSTPEASITLTSPNSNNKNESHGKRDTCFTTPHLKNKVFTLEKQVSHLKEEKSSRKVFTFLILEGAGAQMHTNLRDFSHNRANVSTLYAILESPQWLNENMTVSKPQALHVRTVLEAKWSGEGTPGSRSFLGSLN